jgi:hypothetical protein
MKAAENVEYTICDDCKAENKKLRDRVQQLEDSIKTQNLFLPPQPDPTLADDEWYAIFSDHRKLTTGTITKIPWQGGSNMTAVYKVKRIG